MKKDTTKLKKHLEEHPTDANSLISLLKIQSANFEYDYNLEIKRKREKGAAFQRIKERERKQKND